MSKDIEIIYKDKAITVEEHKITKDKSLIYMYDKSGQREFCMNKQQFDGIMRDYLKLSDKK